MADIFLSYSSQDRERVRPLVAALESFGWSVWWDRRIPPGKTWHQTIEEALDQAQCVVVVWTETSIKSEWVIIEAEEGKARGALFPAFIDDVRPPLSFRLIQGVRLQGWQGDVAHPEYTTLVESVQEKIGKPAVKAPARANQAAPPPVTLLAPTPVVEKPAEPKQASKSVPVPPIQKPKAEPKFENFIEQLPGGVKLEMVAIPGGSFMMGSKTFRNSQPIHQVTLKPFYLGKYQVTQAQWKAVMDSNPSGFKGDDLPVEKVSWNDAQEFCKKLSAQTGRQYRLPSEAEWEYAARAGSKGDYCFGDDVSLLDEYAWYDKNSGNRTHPVGQKKPNAWGLYDVHGNVWEWCEDVWHASYEGAPVDGSARLSGGNQDWRLLRGGSWIFNVDVARAVFRDGSVPAVRGINIGFRVVVVRPPS